MKKKVKIDIVSDIACPWCFIGKRRMETAIAGLPEYEVEVTWHPFQLDPSIPSEGIAKEAYFTNKFGSMERYEMLAENVKDAGASAGINFNFGSEKMIPNTLKMHQLLSVAKQKGFGDELKELLFKAYFENAVDLVKDDELCKIMSAFDWSYEYTLSVLNNEELAQNVRHEINHFQKLGVTGVPFFIFNNKSAFSGAQAPETFIKAIKDLAIAEAAEEAACAMDDPNC